MELTLGTIHYTCIDMIVGEENFINSFVSGMKPDVDTKFLKDTEYIVA